LTNRFAIGLDENLGLENLIKHRQYNNMIMGVSNRHYMPCLRHKSLRFTTS